MGHVPGGLVGGGLGGLAAGESDQPQDRPQAHVTVHLPASLMTSAYSVGLECCMVHPDTCSSHQYVSCWCEMVVLSIQSYAILINLVVFF